MKKAIKKIVTGIVLFLIVFISGLITLVLYPQPLFANRLEYKKFKVYAPTPISVDVKRILDEANRLVAASELNDPSYEYDLFLGDRSFYNRFDDLVLGKGPSARAIDNNIVLKVRIDPKNNLAFPTFYEACQTDLTYLIAHEMVHCLQAHKYGKWKFNPFRHPEMWKLEGYPEYVSKGMSKTDKHKLAKEIDRYLDEKMKRKDGWMTSSNGSCSVPAVYYKSGLMMKYLIDVKKYSYDKILKDTVSENTVYQEMMEWKRRFK